MKRLNKIIFVLIALWGAVSSPLSAASGQTSDTLKVLALGNSFSADAVEQNLFEIARADGQPMLLANMFTQSLKDHATNAKGDLPAYRYTKVVNGVKTVTPGKKLSEVLTEEPWDVITIQQVSQDAAFYDTYEPYLRYMVKYLKKHAPKGARLMWHQTWAYETGDTMSDILKDNFGFRSENMYRDIAGASRRVHDTYGLEVIPTGTAIQNLRSGFTMENTTRDGHHLSLTIGRYTASLTWYETLTGRSCIGNSYIPAAMPNPIRRDAAQRAAHAAVLNRFEVTSQRSGESQYKSEEGGPYNYDEALVPEYSLPDPLVMSDGTEVKTPEDWTERRRPELLKLFRDEVYGNSPAPFEGQHYKVLSEDRNVFGGLATRREVALYYSSKEDKYMVVLMYVPNDVKGPVPAFLMMNLAGNISIHQDEGISDMTDRQLKNFGVYGIPRRGQKQDRYPLEMILDRGYALVTFYKGDVDPDYDDGFKNGVHRYTWTPEQEYPAPDSWGSISAWAWGMSRVMDYLETDPDIDESKVATIGHSRGGKTALWAAAQDTRFAMAISNCSGCTGAAISRRKKGETVRAIQVTFPHWFCTNYLKYMDNEDALPVDQHELLALIAPRPVYVASASLDRGADPRGEFLGAVGAMPVYKLFGYNGLDSTEFPGPHSCIGGDRMGYHLREGRHDILAWDWKHYLDFADKYLK